MKIALIADTHYGPMIPFRGINRKLTQYSMPYMKAFIERISNDPSYAFAVNLGDVIEDENLELDRIRCAESMDLFRTCAHDVYHVIGNHDVLLLPLNEFLSISRMKAPYYSFDRENYHFVVLYAEIPDVKKVEGFIFDEQLSWLKQDLKYTTKPTIVFCHYSLSDQDLTNNPWFYDAPQMCLINNRQEVRQILTNSGKVRAVINGHLHWNNIHIQGGIPFITIQSAVENFRDDDTPANAWAKFEITEDLLKVEVFGNDKLTFEQSLRKMDLK